MTRSPAPRSPGPASSSTGAWRSATAMCQCIVKQVGQQLDNAGWHVALDLLVPPTLTLAPLPPDAPELNAIEKVWQYLRGRDLSGRLFPVTRAIVDACCTAWNSLIAETGRIRSLTDFEWARQINP